MNKALNKALEKGNVGSNLKGFVVLFLLCIILLLLSFYFNNYFFVASIPFSFLFVYAFYITFSKVFSNYNYFKNEIEFLPDGNHFIKAFYNYETLTESVYVLNGKRNGISKILYKNGDVASETVYDNGLKSGNHKEYYESSLLKVDSCYRNNLKNGDFSIYNKEGILIECGSYLKNKLDGQSKEFYDSGNIKKTSNYTNGLLDGLSKEFYESGNIYATANYKKGLKEGNQDKFFDNGQIFEKSKWLEGKIFGIRDYFNDQGVLLRKTNYDKNIGIEYYLNGAIRFEENFSNNQFSFYRKNGTLKFIFFSYQDDNERIRFNAFTHDYSNSSFRRPHGVWKYFDNKNNLVCEIDFTNGYFIFEKTFNIKTNDFNIKLLQFENSKNVYFYNNEFNERILKYSDYEPDINDMFKFKKWNISIDNLRPYYRESDDDCHYFSFYGMYSAQKLLVELIYLVGGSKEVKKVFTDTDDNYKEFFNPQKNIINEDHFLWNEKDIIISIYKQNFLLDNTYTAFNSNGEEIDYSCVVKVSKSIDKYIQSKITE